MKRVILASYTVDHEVGSKLSKYMNSRLSSYGLRSVCLIGGCVPTRQVTLYLKFTNGKAGKYVLSDLSKSANIKELAQQVMDNYESIRPYALTALTSS